MTRFVQRDENGIVIGHFANPQIGYAEEEVEDDNPDLLAYTAARMAPPVPKPRRIQSNTIFSRIEATIGAAGLDAAVEAITAQTPGAFFRMIAADQVGGTLVDDPRLIAGLVALGLDPAIILRETD